MAPEPGQPEYIVMMNYCRFTKTENFMTPGTGVFAGALGRGHNGNILEMRDFFEILLLLLSIDLTTKFIEMMIKEVHT